MISLLPEVWKELVTLTPAFEGLFSLACQVHYGFWLSRDGRQLLEQAVELPQRVRPRMGSEKRKLGPQGTLLQERGECSVIYSIS